MNKLSPGWYTTRCCEEAGERLLEAGALKLAGDLDYGLYWAAILQLK